MTEMNYGFLEKLFRIQKGLSISNVSEDLKWAKGNLSEIENGKRKMSRENIDKFICYYGIPFDFSLDKERTGRNLIIELGKSLIFQNYETEKRIKEYFYNHKSELEVSGAAFYALVLESYFELSSSENQKGASDLVYAENFLPAFSGDIRSLVLFLRGAEEERRFHYNQAIHYYKKSLSCLDRTIWVQIDAPIIKRLGICTGKAESFSQGILYLKSATEIFSKNRNYHQVASADIEMARLFICLMNYDFSLALLDKVVNLDRNFITEKKYRQALKLKIRTLILSGNYQEAISYLSELPEQASESVENALLKSWIFWMMDESSKALTILQSLRTRQMDPNEKLWFQLLKGSLSHNDDQTESAAVKLFRTSAKKYEWINLIFLFRALIQYYRDTDQDKKLVSMFESYLALLQHRIDIPLPLR